MSSNDYTVEKKSLALYIFFLSCLIFVLFGLTIGFFATLSDGSILYSLFIALATIGIAAVVVFIFKTFIFPKDGFLEMYIYDDKLVFKYPKLNKETTIAKTDVKDIQLFSSYGGFSTGMQLASGSGVQTISVNTSGGAKHFDTNWSSKSGSKIERDLQNRGYRVALTMSSVYGSTTTVKGEMTAGTGIGSTKKPKFVGLYMVLTPIFLLAPTLTTALLIYSEVRFTAMRLIGNILGITGLLMSAKLINVYITNKNKKLIAVIIVLFVFFFGAIILTELNTQIKCSDTKIVKNRDGSSTRLCLEKGSGDISELNY